MKKVPHLKQVKQAKELEQYSQTYEQYAGLPIPTTYLNNPHNRIFACYHQNKMIGGFILGQGERLRTVEVFAEEKARGPLYQRFAPIHTYTEITCFWMSPTIRKHTLLNTFVWLALTYCMQRYSNAHILFGTCSTPLARLYGITEKSRLIHQDVMEGKRTYIFESAKKESLLGFLEILRYKLKRSFRIQKGKKAWVKLIS
ncbi:MAG: hypothetical protein AAGH79_03190 [Bacteroidota bacterium]